MFTLELNTEEAALLSLALSLALSVANAMAMREREMFVLLAKAHTDLTRSHVKAANSLAEKLNAIQQHADVKKVIQGADVGL